MKHRDHVPPGSDPDHQNPEHGCSQPGDGEPTGQVHFSSESSGVSLEHLRKLKHDLQNQLCVVVMGMQVLEDQASENPQVLQTLALLREGGLEPLEHSVAELISLLQVLLSQQQ